MSTSLRPNLLKTLVKWRLLIAIIMLAILAAGIYITYRMEPLYRASAVIQVGGAENTFSADPNAEALSDSYFLTQFERLRSRTVAEPVVRTLSLHNDPAYADQSLPDDRRVDQAVTTMLDKVSVFLIPDTKLITLEAVEGSANRVAAIPNLMAETFLDIHMEEQAASPKAVDAALRERLAALRAELEDAERALAEFADAIGPSYLSNLRGRGEGLAADPNMSDYRELSENFLQAQLRATELRQRYRQASTNQQVREFINSSELNSLKSRKRELEAEYQSNLATYKPGFPLMRELQAEIDVLDRQINAETQTILQSIQAERDAAVETENQLKARLDNREDSLRNSLSNNVDYNVLQREVDSKRAQYEAVLERLVDVAAVNGITVGNVSIVDRAAVPDRPFQPNWPVMIIGCLLIGAVSSGFLVFMIEMIDDKVKSPDDVEDRIGLPVLGVVPSVPKKTISEGGLYDPQSSLSEAVFSIRANLTSHFDENEPTVIHVTSTRPDEGKSSTAFLLARSFADLNLKTLILDGDMRKPTFTSDKLGEKGMMKIISDGLEPLTQVVPTRVPDLYLLPCGGKPENPSAILGSAKFRAILDRLKRTFDIIIIDAPPVLGLADSPSIGAVSDYSVYLVQYDAIRVSNLRASINRLVSSGSNLLGVVLTKYEATLGSYADSYYYSYGKESQNYGKEKEANGLLAKLFRGKAKRKRLDII